jgi:hypothetical protein
LEIDLNFLPQLFPSELMEYFVITKSELQNASKPDDSFWIIDFEEKNVLPAVYDPKEYKSKGFMKSKQIQDFPLRGRPVFLRIKIRRWQHKKTRKIIKRDFSFIADGSKFTKELSDFLKDTGRYTS